MINQSESRPNVLFALLLFNDDDDDKHESAEIRRPLAVDVAAYHVVTPAVQSSGRPSVRGVASSTCCHYTRIIIITMCFQTKPIQNKGRDA